MGITNKGRRASDRKKQEVAGKIITIEKLAEIDPWVKKMLEAPNRFNCTGYTGPSLEKRTRIH